MTYTEKQLCAEYTTYIVSLNSQIMRISAEIAFLPPRNRKTWLHLIAKSYDSHIHLGENGVGALLAHCALGTLKSLCSPDMPSPCHPRNSVCSPLWLGPQPPAGLPHLLPILFSHRTISTKPSLMTLFNIANCLTLLPIMTWLIPLPLVYFDCFSIALSPSHLPYNLLILSIIYSLSAASEM